MLLATEEGEMQRPHERPLVRERGNQLQHGRHLVHERWKVTSLLGLIALGAACGDDAGGSLADILTDTRTATPMECPPDGDGVVLRSGQDTNLNGTLEASEVTFTEPVCEPVDGDSGDPGDPGLNALVRTSAEPEGDNCANGGSRVDSGLDDNADGILQSGEIDATSYICNGDQGPTGLSFVVRTSDQVGEQCEENGGVLIETGLDTNRNDTLDDEEVSASTIACSGGDGFDTLVDIQAEPAGGNCPAGGQQVRRGFDANRSGTLDPTEVDDVSFFCNPVAVLTNTSTASPPDCPSAGIQLDTGVDTNANALLEPDEITATRFFCSNQGEAVLTTTSTEGPGTNCSAGGLRIDTGNDSNFNGTLDPDEIDSTVYTCDADPGLDGRGASAVRVTPEPAGVNCAQGGTRVDTGPDTNGNSVLDDPEITETTYTCNGADRTLLVEAVSIPPGLTCINGGQEIIQGGDVDNDGVLDPSEIQSSTIVCSASEVVAIAVLTASLRDAFVGRNYVTEIEVIGGLGGQYNWSVQSGSLPPGLSLAPFGNPANGQLSGTVTATGTFTFTVAVQDLIRSSATATFTLNVTEPCEPGRQGLAGSNSMATLFPTPFQMPTTESADTDTSTTGWVYLMGTSSLDRVRKDGTVIQDLLVPTNLTTADLGFEVEVDGQNIYITSDRTGTLDQRVFRISTDGGQTFAADDMVTFATAPGIISGVEVLGTTMFILAQAGEIYSADISGPLPAPAALVTNFNAFANNCGGLAADSLYWYTVCGAFFGGTSDPIIRIERATLTPEIILNDLGFMDNDDLGGNGVRVQDTNNDGISEILLVQGLGTTGNKVYWCDPTQPGPIPAPETSGGAERWANGLNTDQGFGIDDVNGVIWTYDNTTDGVLSLP
jgi:hypothetical protein